MKRSRFKEEQIIAILREQEAGSPTADVCRKHGISSGHVLQVEGEVRRPRRVGCQAAEGAGGREREAEEAACRDDAGQRDPEGHQQPKVVTPAAQAAGRGSRVRGARGERAAGVRSSGS